MNQERNNDQQVHVQKPVSGPSVRSGAQSVHGGEEKAGNVHGLRLVGTANDDLGKVHAHQDEKGMIPGFIFVFGSNNAGIHGGGAARTAFDFRGFPWGCGEGLAKMCYALPTKDIHIETLPIEIVRRNIHNFLALARDIWSAEAAYGADPETVTNGHTKFQVTRIGCGLAGFKDEDIAPAFVNAPSNCWFDDAWKPWLKGTHQFWGTF